MDDDWENTTIVVSEDKVVDEEEEDEAFKELEEEEKNRKEFLEKQKQKKQEPKAPKPKVKQEVKEEAPRELTREELLRIREEEKKSDYESAMDLLSVNNKRSIAPSASKAINEFTPKSVEEFDEFSLYLSSYIKNFDKEYYYPRFVKGLFRSLCSDLTIEELKDIEKSISAVINEKIKESKPQKKKKGGDKVSLNIKAQSVDEFDNIGYTHYDYSDDDGDDFM